MSAENIFDLIRKGVIEHRDQGNKVVEIEKLLEYLNALEAEVSDEDEIDVQKEAEIERIRSVYVNQQLQYNWKKDFKLAHHLWRKDASLEMFKSIIASGQNSLRACMLIHAGACIALLAFVGNLVSSAETRGLVGLFSGVMLWFVVGVLLVAVAYGATYLTQLFYDDKKRKHWGKFFHIASTVLAIGSYALFGIGSYAGYESMMEMSAEAAVNTEVSGNGNEWTPSLKVSKEADIQLKPKILDEAPEEIESIVTVPSAKAGAEAKNEATKHSH